MPAHLSSVRTLRVSWPVISDTWRALRTFGRSGHEGFVLWLGLVDEDQAVVEQALVPAQESIRGEDGVGYFVTADTLFQLNRALHRSGRRLIAQVHSHPTAAYHSPMDDAYAVVTTEGGFSIVVPNFANGSPSPRSCAVYRLRRGIWTELGSAEVERMCLWGVEAGAARRLPPE